MPTSYKLVIYDDASTKTLEVEVIDNNRVLLQEESDDPPSAFWFNLSQEEWTEMKNYIDSKFNSNG